ncbi:sphingomyelin phosphodiesterase 4 [Pieris brassicae]|uniref:Sphingomyelin phosphodiesterase 4 n=1 Tax=Pieris brassicae TaxID=7116 RepID=A0A9P0XCD3_PIEBR|nr:sphingomyelin phosphodiesterase 4 [Pieris brassicae]CAH4029637.1 unnamed protein product [Pieris brassicae]
MENDIMSQFYAALNLPLLERTMELTRILDQSGPTKDYQALFPQLISNIFSSPANNGWGLRHLTYEQNRFEFEALINFLEPQGPLFRMCYKLLSDPQLKYNLLLNNLPLDLQMMLERGGRCPQFYSDMVTLDANSLNIVSLALNPFDYYIFKFALHLTSNNQNSGTWEIWNSAYFALACDYLTHFLPSDPNTCILPQIPHYNGKVPLVAPLQSVNRPLGSPSLLLVPDLSGISNQHPPPQNQSRNEIWRSETVLQVFIDIWMSVEHFDMRNIEMYQRNYTGTFSSPERVRLVRVVIKQIYSYSSKYNSDPAIRSSALRKYAKQIMCSRAYQYVKHLVSTWPLDASFRLVMELWLSLIQPWRYTNTVSQDRFSHMNRNQDEGSTAGFDPTYIQFVAENFPSYICILQLMLPRFMRLDLTTYKNAVMLFRLGKVFSQHHLTPVLMNLEKAVVDSISGSMYTPNNSLNNSNVDHSYMYNGISLHKWVSVAKQAISEFDTTSTLEYNPIWTEDKKPLYVQFVKKVISAKAQSEKLVEEYRSKFKQNNQGVWAGVKQWFMISYDNEDKILLEESEKVPAYLNHCINYFTNILVLNESLPIEVDTIDSSMEQSSFANSNNFSFSIAQKLRNKSTGVQYTGDPDLMPIMSYENTILVRFLYQLATKLNEIYEDDLMRWWNRDGFWGYAVREVLQKPLTVQTYMKDMVNHKNIVLKELPPRLSLRRFASNFVIVWFTIGYFAFRFLSYSGLFYVFFLIMMFCFIVLTKASLKMFKILKS